MAGEQFPAVTLPVTPGMRDDIEPHAAPVGTITRAKNVRFPRLGGIQPRWGVNQLDISGIVATRYTSNLNTAQGPDFTHPSKGGFVFGAQGYGFRHDAALNETKAEGCYSRCQPRGKLTVSAREELETADVNLLSPWPLSQAVAGALVATCHASGNGQPALAGGPVVGTQADVGTLSTATAGAVVRVFSHDGTPVASHYYETAESAMVVDDATPVGPNGAGLIQVVFQEGANLRVRSISENGASPSTVASIGTLASAASFYAACRWPGQGWAVVWQSAATTLSIKKMLGRVQVGATATINVPTGTIGMPVSIYADATNLYIGWATRTAPPEAAGQVRDTAMGVNATFSLLTGTLANQLGPPLWGSSKTAGTVLALVASAIGVLPQMSDNSSTHLFKVTNLGVVAAFGAFTQLSLLPLSAPFADGLWWARHATRSPTGIQTMRAVLLDCYEVRTGAQAFNHPKVALVGDSFTLAEQTLIPACIYRQHLHTPVQLSSGEYVMGIPRLVRSEEAANSVQQYLALSEWLKFAVGCEQQCRTVGEDILATGSLVAINSAPGLHKFPEPDTQLPSTGLDIGLLQMPSISALAQSTGSGTMTALGSYQYRAVLELIDERGRRWRSAPSSVARVTLTGTNNQVTVTVQAWTHILRAFNVSPAVSRIMVHIYRTVSGGFTFQRVTPPSGGPVTAVNGSFDFLDTMPDIRVAAHEFLYTDGGVLQNDHPPSCRFIADTEDRVWLGGLWDANIIQSSKTIVPGEGIAFSDLDAFKVDLKEPCTGLAAQDGILFAFTASRVYAIQGLGPNQQGQGAWDDAKREISRATGCINWRSIVETTAGVLYQSKRGIMLVPRGGGEPQFIGAAVQKLLVELGGVITGASFCQTIDSHTVRFCLEGGVIVLDLGTMAWSFDEPNDPIVPVGTTVWSKVCDTELGPVLARKVNYFDREVRGLTIDDWGPFGSKTIESSVSWAPVRPGGLAGWGMFLSAIGVFGKLDGLPYPATALTFKATIDNDASGLATRATMADFQPLIDFRRLALRNRQGCSAALEFTTAGAPWRFVGWTIETQDLDGPRRTPPGEYL